ncbi:NTPase KAP [Novacetimonas hansenii]|uniref:ATPase n=3 Tax=Acetobacteraceae TaxID=433 RepID=A0ABQ0SFB4_NOVHA|nr:MULTISPECIES: Qat anti-phage system ATPase QatA [Acetobacteraceae]EFG84762.1 KAP P-loop [Novacetimonas hansenii ATCC 23769]MCG4254944.1 KAP family NTPase [Acetobacter senegalensis]MCP1195041.1 KAP family NTPase [Acetobacter senegalensis]QHC34288.1 NTPase KAP [Komagataeibacter xylinus]QOF94953.1 NTPase KAP [Novacetimonas hansenii]
MLLADNETTFDLLNNDAIAKTIVGLITEDPERAVTVGVHGDWGAGKSSVLEMIEASFADHDETLCIKFNAWRFQGLEDAKIALIEGVVTQLIEKRSLTTKAADAVKDVVKRIDWLKVARMGGGLAFTAMSGLPSPDHVGAVVGMVKGFFADPAKYADKEQINKVIEGAEGLLKEKESRRVPQEVEEFRKAFDELLNRAGLKQLVVLIDDLDRCLPEPAIETLEAMRLFVMMDRTAFVIAADEAMIEYSVRKHFPDLPDTTGPRDYARNYLEKLIQIPFRIPALGGVETHIYVTLLLVGARLGDEDAQFKALVAVAREALKRPWDPTGFDGAAVQAALGARAKDVADDLVLTEQIVPLLASGTSGNPRQIKRFLNSLLLRERTADARGFGAAVKLPVLAKLMLAERFIPTLFDEIGLASANDPDGRCKDLAVLEEGSKPETARAPAPLVAGGEGKKVVPPKAVAAPEPATVENPVLTQWQASDVIKAWAKLQPPLSNVDLRPYLFVTKDRKDYLAAASALGPLAAVVERLMGRRMAVSGMDAELRALAKPEASLVFDYVRRRILGAGDFSRPPAGIDGATILVRTQPHLQSALLDMLGTLPASSGPWIVAGWSEVITEDAERRRFQTLLERWSKATDNPALAASATAALRTRAKG